MLYMQAQCIFCYINPLVGGGDKKQINNNKNQKRLKTDKQLIVYRFYWSNSFKEHLSKSKGLFKDGTSLIRCITDCRQCCNDAKSV